jgi:hypothetical protein
MNPTTIATKGILSLLLLTTLASCTFFSKKNIQAVQTTANPTQFERVDWSISVTGEWINPYSQNDFALDMVITMPDGSTQAIPCYYESGESGSTSQWGARLNPVEAGIYSYHFETKRNGEVTEKTKVETFTVAPGNGRGFLHPHNDWTFRYTNGEPFRGVGITFGWESRSNDDSRYFKELHEQDKYSYEHMLSLLQSVGGNYFRTWMCPWNLPLEWKIVSPDTDRYSNSDEHFNPDAIRKMDELTLLCDSLGLHMMLAIDQAGGFMGGSWDAHNYNIKNGGMAETPYHFFTLPEARQQYKDRLRYMVARWGYSPSIGAWEFFNEIDYLAYKGNDIIDSMQTTIVEWHTEMATYLKSIDPYGRPVTTSISHFDVKGLNSIPDIDFNQKHIYKNTQIIPSTIRDYVDKYGKPYVIGEFGYEWDWSLNFNDFAAEMDSDFKRGLWYGLFSPTPILPMSWWWEFFESRGMFPYIARVREINDHMIAAGNGDFYELPVSSLSGSLHAMGVICGSVKYVYIFNKDQKRTPVNFMFEKDFTGKPQRIEYFNCETGEYKLLSQSYIKNSGEFVAYGLMIEPESDIILILRSLE